MTTVAEIVRPKPRREVLQTLLKDYRGQLRDAWAANWTREKVAKIQESIHSCVLELRQLDRSGQ